MADGDLTDVTRVPTVACGCAPNEFREAGLTPWGIDPIRFR